MNEYRYLADPTIENGVCSQEVAPKPWPYGGRAERDNLNPNPNRIKEQQREVARLRAELEMAQNTPKRSVVERRERRDTIAAMRGQLAEQNEEIARLQSELQGGVRRAGKAGARERRVNMLAMRNELEQQKGEISKLQTELVQAPGAGGTGGTGGVELEPHASAMARQMAEQREKTMALQRQLVKSEEEAQAAKQRAQGLEIEKKELLRALTPERERSDRASDTAAAMHREIEQQKRALEKANAEAREAQERVRQLELGTEEPRGRGKVGRREATQQQLEEQRKVPPLSSYTPWPQTSLELPV